MALVDDSTLLPALDPSVTVPRLIPTLLLSLVPVMLIGPEAARILPPRVTATSTLAMPAEPARVMPPPTPVASTVPLKLIPKLELVPLTLDASPTTVMACAVVLADRMTQPLEYDESACALMLPEPVALPVMATLPVPESMVVPADITPKDITLGEPPEFSPLRVISPPPEEIDVPDWRFTPEMWRWWVGSVTVSRVASPRA